MALFTKNVELGGALKLSSWRKIAIGTWHAAGDPSVYASMDIDAGPALEYIEKIKAKTGIKITFTHFIGKVIGKVIEKNPQLNCILRFGRLYPRKSIDVFFQVATDSEGKDLTGIVIRNINQRSISEIALEMQERVQQIREKGDAEFKKMKGLMAIAPGFIVRYLINLAGFLMYTLNIWSPLLGSPKDPFGSVMVTSIGSLGLHSAFAPLVPYTRVPFVLAVGIIKEMPVVKNGKIEIGMVCQLSATFDHRLIDGMGGSKMAQTLNQILQNPEVELGF